MKKGGGDGIEIEPEKRDVEKDWDRAERKGIEKRGEEIEEGHRRRKMD